jgi:hypothetical protein
MAGEDGLAAEAEHPHPELALVGNATQRREVAEGNVAVAAPGQRDRAGGEDRGGDESQGGENGEHARSSLSDPACLPPVHRSVENRVNNAWVSRAVPAPSRNCAVVPDMFRCVKRNRGGSLLRCGEIPVAIRSIWR